MAIFTWKAFGADVAEELETNIVPKARPGSGESVDLVILGFGLWRMKNQGRRNRKKSDQAPDEFSEGVQRVIKVVISPTMEQGDQTFHNKPFYFSPCITQPFLSSQVPFLTRIFYRSPLYHKSALSHFIVLTLGAGSMAPPVG